jgi:hypothetical protein
MTHKRLMTNNNEPDSKKTNPNQPQLCSTVALGCDLFTKQSQNTSPECQRRDSCFDKTNPKSVSPAKSAIPVFAKQSQFARFRFRSIPPTSRHGRGIASSFCSGRG